MKNEKIEDAVKVAKVFLNRAKTCLLERSKTYKCGDLVFHPDAPKESGALRRASMELTRALAEMRKP